MTVEILDSQPGGTAPLRVNFENVVKQGLLYKKGTILRLYNNECMFYLEKRRDGCGPFLKFGPKRKSLTTCVDLGCFLNTPSGPLQEKPKVFLIRTPGSRTKFKIITTGSKLSLKANTKGEREEWIRRIAEVIREGVGEEGAVIENDDGTIDELTLKPSLTKKKQLSG
jgi:hypothetical protein